VESVWFSRGVGTQYGPWVNTIRSTERLLWFLFLVLCLLLALPVMWIYLAGVPRTPVVEMTSEALKTYAFWSQRHWVHVDPLGKSAGLFGMGRDCVHPDSFLMAHWPVHRERFSAQYAAGNDVQPEEPSDHQTLGFDDRYAEKALCRLCPDGQRSESPLAFFASSRFEELDTPYPLHRVCLAQRVFSNASSTSRI